MDSASLTYSALRLAVLIYDEYNEYRLSGQEIWFLATAMPDRYPGNQVSRARFWFAGLSFSIPSKDPPHLLALPPWLFLQPHFFCAFAQRSFLCKRAATTAFARPPRFGRRLCRRTSRSPHGAAVQQFFCRFCLCFCCVRFAFAAISAAMCAAAAFCRGSSGRISLVARGTAHQNQHCRFHVASG